MKIINNKTINKKNEFLEECVCCGSELILDENDYSEAGAYGIKTFLCPCCNNISDSKYEIELNIHNIQYPQNFNIGKQSQSDDKEIQEHIKRLLKSMTPDQYYNYIEWKDNIVIALREEDDDLIRLIVCTKFSDTICSI